MNIDDPKLTAYALGELSAEERHAIERELQNNPEARSFVEETAAFAGLLSKEFHEEIPPLELAATQRAEIVNEAVTSRKVLPFPLRRIAWAAGIGAVAAALAIVAALPSAIRSSDRKGLARYEENEKAIVAMTTSDGIPTLAQSKAETANPFAVAADKLAMAPVVPATAAPDKPTYSAGGKDLDVPVSATATQSLLALDSSSASGHSMSKAGNGMLKEVNSYTGETKTTASNTVVAGVPGSMDKIISGDAAAPVPIAKIGTDKLAVLNGRNTYTGGTIITSGSLVITGENANLPGSPNTASGIVTLGGARGTVASSPAPDATPAPPKTLGGSGGLAQADDSTLKLLRRNANNEPSISDGVIIAKNREDTPPGAAQALDQEKTRSRALKAAFPADKWRFREVVFEVHDPDGKPTPGVKVFLMGVERDGIRDLDDDTNSNNKNWNFVTDAKGRFTARFGDFRSYDYEEVTHDPMPGYGGFYMVAEYPGTAGGVSPYLKNVEKTEDQLLSLSGELNEWQKGEFALLNVAKPPVPVVIQLKRGITVTGSVRDLEGRPVANCQIGTMHDLHATSHTGFGGQMLPARTDTDANGNYRIEHVYPNRFDMDASGVWIKTRVRGGPWQEKRIDDLTPGSKEKEIRVDLVVVKKPPYHYFGKVTDAQGQPVPNAEVTLGVSRHWPSRTYGDNHHFENATTDAKGEYELYVESRLVRGFTVEAPGFKRETQWVLDDYSGTPYKPGFYDFQLSK